jgi:hypothetical protein
MHGIEIINYWNEGDNYKYRFAGRPPGLHSGKPSSINEHQPTIKVPQGTSNQSLLIIGQVLNALLSLKESLPSEVRQALETAQTAVVSAT